MIYYIVWKIYEMRLLMDIKWTCPYGKTNTSDLIEVLDFCQICECGRECEVNIEVTVTEVNELKD